MVSLKSAERKEKIDFKNISAEALQLAEKALIQKDPLLLAEKGYLKIKTKKMQLINAAPNPPQKRFFKLMKTLLATNQPVFVVIYKSRQWGGSTASEEIAFSITSQKENVNALIIADDVDGASYILDMAHTMQEEFEKDFPWLSPSIDRSSRREIVFDKLRSRMFIQTAQNVYAGQKYTIHILHASEAAKYPKADLLFAGLLPAVAKVPGSIRIIESTANGAGNYFHRLVKEAQENTRRLQPDFKNYRGEPVLFFVPPWEDPDCYLSFSSNVEKEEFINGMDEGEKALLNVSYDTYEGSKNVCLEQLNWRRHTIQNTYRGDKNQFNQYYPVNVDVGFLASGRTRFDADRLRIIYDYAISQKPQIGYLACPTEYQLQTMPELQKNPNIVIFNQDQSGDWSIWEMPDPREEYVIFCDPAGGEEVEGAPEGEQGDYNCIEIFRRGKDQLVQSAEYRSRIDPDILADEAFLGWRAYYEPFTLGVEVNSIGRSTADHLKHRAPVYHREILDEATKKVTKKLGWYTDTISRKTMIDEMAAGIRDGWLVIRSTVLAGEAMTFIRDSRGKYQAQQGCFDDTVMCTAGAIQMHLRTRRKKDGIQQIGMKNTSFRQPGKIESQFIQMKSKSKNRSKI